MNAHSGRPFIVDFLHEMPVEDVEKLQKEARTWSSEIRRELRMLTDQRLAHSIDKTEYEVRRLEKQEEAARCKKVITRLTEEVSLRRKQASQAGAGTAKPRLRKPPAFWIAPPQHH